MCIGKPVEKAPSKTWPVKSLIFYEMCSGYPAGAVGDITCAGFKQFKPPQALFRGTQQPLSVNIT